MNLDLTPVLSTIGNLPIDKFQIDTKNDTIKFNFDRKDNPNQISQIVFNEVTSFYYLDHDSDDQLEKDNNQLNNIMYCGGSSEIIEGDEDVQVSVPNFILELNASNVFIEANSIVINERKFIV